MFNLKCVASLLLASYVGLARAEVVTVGAEDPRIKVDQYFFLDTQTPACPPNYWTDTPGATATFDFTGTSVTLIGSTGGRGGIFEVFLDNILQAAVNRYANSAKDVCGMVMFEKLNLPNVAHTFKFVFKGNSTEARPSAGGGIMDVIEIRYSIPDSTTTNIPTTQTFPTVTHDTATPTVVAKKIPVGAVVGGSVGGVAFLVCTLFAAFLFYRHRRKRNSEQRPSPSSEEYQGGKADYTPYEFQSPISSPGPQSPPPYPIRTTSTPQTGFSWGETSTIRSTGAATTTSRPLPSTPAQRTSVMSYPTEKSSAGPSSPLPTESDMYSTRGLPFGATPQPHEDHIMRQSQNMMPQGYGDGGGYGYSYR
ncbi:hypothetical protein FRC03_008122 [Tulasnella sp. 419]|nr:hypothetical protein FRC03_008122 [Tulasnella sp. 419]